MSERKLLIVSLQFIIGLTLSNVSSSLADSLRNLHDNEANTSTRKVFWTNSEPINPSKCPISRNIFPTNTSLQKRQYDEDLPFQCMRRYFHEPTKQYDLYFIEDTIDEKAANLIYITGIINPLNYEISTFSSENAHLKQQTAGSSYNKQLCSQHLNSMITILEELNRITDARRRKRLNETSLKLDESHLRLARVLDSYGRYEPSLMSGKQHFLGSYSQCQGSQMILDKSARNSKVAARYCTAQLKFDKHLNHELKIRKKLSHETKLNLKVGICIPETCHTISFEENKQNIQRLVDWSFKLPSHYYVEEHPEAESIFCGVDEGSAAAEIPLSGKLLICFVTCWMSLVAYSTYKQNIRSETFTERPQRNSLLYRVYQSTSLQTSCGDFISANEISDTKEKVDLNFLNLIKVFIQLLVLSLHTALWQYVTVADLPRYFATAYVNRFTSLSYRLDTLFTVSGIFIVNSEYKSNKSMLKNEINLRQKFNWFFRLWYRRSVKRYLRLVPLYFLVVWFKKSLFPRLGSGPIWDHGFNNKTLIGACYRESWFVPLTYENSLNYMSLQCLPQSWYIANEVFFIIYLTPIIVLTIIKPRLAFVSGILIAILSAMAMTYGLITMPPRLLDSFHELQVYSFQGMFLEYSYIYAAPYYHIFAYLCGIFSGYLLHNYNEDPAKRWPKWMTGKFTYFCSLLVIILTLEQGLLSSFGIAPPFMFEFTLTGGRIITSLATTVLFLRAATDCKDNFLIRFSGTKFWRIAAKLTYSIYLTHWDFMHYERLTLLSLSYYSGFTIFFTAGAHILFSICIGLIFYLLFEAPFDKLVQNFVFPSSETSQKCIEKQETSTGDCAESKLQLYQLKVSK